MADHHQGRWSAARRAAWIALFWAILGWAALIDPRTGIFREDVSFVAWIGA